MRLNFFLIRALITIKTILLWQTILKTKANQVKFQVTAIQSAQIKETKIKLNHRENKVHHRGPEIHKQ